MNEIKAELHREFEMERVILFSDAVFAIAITLLIIEIKFPDSPDDPKTANYFQIFKHTIVEGAAFILSFFFIGNFWAKHLRLCRQMKHYDQGVILRNLIFLFFIVTFPFTAKGLAEHVKPGYVLPIFIYMINITCCNVAHTWLCHYIFYNKPHLSISGDQDEKKFIYLKSAYLSVALVILILLESVIIIIFPNNLFYFGLCLYLIPLFALYTRRKLKKYRPVKSINFN